MAIRYLPTEDPNVTGYGKVRLVLETTTNRGQNSTLCNIKLQVQSVDPSLGTVTLAGFITFDGENITLSGSKSTVVGSWVTVAEYDRNVKHNEDGNKTLTIAVGGTSLWTDGLTAYRKSLYMDYFFTTYIPTASWDIALEAIAWRFTLAKTDDGHSSVIVARQVTNEPTAKLGNLANGDHIYYGDKLKVTFTPAMGYKSRCEVDGEEITTNPYRLTVTKDVSVAVEGTPMATIRVSNGSEQEQYIFTISDGIERHQYQAYICDGEQWRVYC